jgi:beta-lactamase class A
MVLFRKKKEEEVEDEYDDEEELPKKKTLKNKDFKDLKSENRKLRKEPKKPWGRKERIFVLLAILLTAGTSGILALSARSWKLPGLPRLEMPLLSIPRWGEDVIIIEANRVDKEKSEKVVQEFRKKTKELSGVYGLYVINLNSGFSYGVRETEIFQAASLIKLPVIAAMYRESERGNISLDDIHILANSDKVAGAGSLYTRPAGYQITYKEMLDLMGKQSDNSAFRICRNLLGDAQINETARSIGMVDTSVATNETTPRDVGVFFEELWNGKVVSDESRDQILESLTDTIYEEWLAAGIPNETRVAHKFGRETHVVNDAGIVFSDESLIIVIMSKGIVEREADQVIPELAKLVFENQAN